ncbi:tripartite tricarboxylate transporter substrate binding protein [Cupriavidus sp. AU9028]|uniref:Bug family tripartite tricarboxylate transporter substrate binding protein n=1 Tax=Cupriavidus sp. AU9028 TaxID=2871157 RepID=UPI001C96C049|nr:tripartite tricarboxylate transporter substrate binding protein [Cupriavidus sp. AU9028]MBY4895892.1 tripartite tricarboxylate transporter substrate binding protein [Cupriavidus sp. AU9028]
MQAVRHSLRRRTVLALAALCAMPAFANAADKYPSKPIRLVVAFAAGGANDIIARILAKEMGQSMGQTFVVENRAGAGGMIGSDAVAKAAPDGYTLLLGSAGAQTVLPAVNRKLPYDPRKDLVPVSLVAEAANVLLVKNDLPFNNVKELIAGAKQKPGTYTYASSGNGSTLHVSGALMEKLAGIELLHIPYKGNGPAINDLYSGNVDMVFSGVPIAMASLKTGKAKVLAVTTKKRIKSMPNVPTIEEAGVPGYEFSSWYGLFATGGTDPAIVEQLAREVKKALAKPDVVAALAQQGVEPESSTPAEFKTRVNEELSRWDRDIKTMKIGG